MKNLLNKKIGTVSIVLGCFICIVIGYYIGVERSFTAFESISSVGVAL
jgi:hypothetical protein